MDKTTTTSSGLRLRQLLLLDTSGCSGWLAAEETSRPASSRQQNNDQPPPACAGHAGFEMERSANAAKFAQAQIDGEPLGKISATVYCMQNRYRWFAV